MFMLHSSEFMAGGSPTFLNERDIEQLYADLETLFAQIAHSFKGRTLTEFYHLV
jgi:coproporphyrinogen III oxidase-like Fe-S oxidoreductase